jgi:hypothetical protein
MMLCFAPGVQSVSMIHPPPLVPIDWTASVSAHGAVAKIEEPGNALLNYGDPDVFRTLGIPFYTGRDFTFQDTLSSPKVCILNEALAKHLFQEGNSVNRHIDINFGKGSIIDAQVIGVVKNAKYRSLRESSASALYLSTFQFPEYLSSAMLAIRNKGEQAGIARAVAGQVKELGIERLKSVHTLSLILDDQLSRDRLLAALSGGLGFLAILTACPGLYSMVSHWLIGRTREFGIRIALGAKSSNLYRTILVDTLIFVVVGIGAGLAGAIYLNRMFAGLLFGSAEYYSFALAFSACFAAAVSFAAAFMPTFRALSADPALSLRYE